MAENAYLNIKHLKASKALKQAPDPATNSSLCYISNFRPQKLGAPPGYELHNAIVLRQKQRYVFYVKEQFEQILNLYH